MRRLLVPLVPLLVLLAVPATGHAYTLGVSDQQASTFTNPLFAPLKFKAARYITPYDVMDSPSDLAAAQAWIGAAAGGQPARPRLVRALAPRRPRAAPAVGRRVQARDHEVPPGLPDSQGDLGLERGQPLPVEDAPRRPADVRQGAAPRRRTSRPRARSSSRRARRSSPSTCSTSRTSAKTISDDPQVQALRRLEGDRSSASTTTRTRTASRRRARAACSRPGAARCG